MFYNEIMDIETGDKLPMPELVPIIPALPANYTDDDETRDSRVNAILNQVSSFCGKDFTEVPDEPVAPENPEEKDPPIEDPDELEKAKEQYQKDLAKYNEDKAAYDKAKATNLQEKKDYWAILWQVLRLISDYTCWTDSYDDTFILQHRTQTFNLQQLGYCQQFSCGCRFNKPIYLDIFYTPLDPNGSSDEVFSADCQVQAFISGSIEYIDNNGEVKVETISPEYLNSHYNPHKEQLEINPKDFTSLYAGKCSCPEDISIVIHYNAGYLTIPQAILPLICQLIGRIGESSLPVGECAAAMTQVSGLLKSKKVGNIQYTWSDSSSDNAKTQTLFTDIYNIAILAEVSSISRCDIVSSEEAGFVV